MSLYESYLEEIEERKAMGLNPKPIDDEALANEVISQIRDTENKHREDSLNYFIYNMLPGTTGAANAKAKFLKEIVNDIKSETIKKFVESKLEFQIYGY